MAIDTMSTHSTSHDGTGHEDGLAQDLRLAGPMESKAEREITAESSTVHGIVGAAMVGLLGGGPRLAIRAARVVLEDSYGSRSPARAGQGRLRGLTRRRGE